MQHDGTDAIKWSKPWGAINFNNHSNMLNHLIPTLAMQCTGNMHKCTVSNTLSSAWASPPWNPNTLAWHIGQITLRLGGISTIGGSSSTWGPHVLWSFMLSKEMQICIGCSKVKLLFLQIYHTLQGPSTSESIPRLSPIHPVSTVFCKNLHYQSLTPNLHLSNIAALFLHGCRGAHSIRMTEYAALL